MSAHLSLKQISKDLLVLSAIISLVVALIGILILYIQSHDANLLYMGLIIAFIIVFGVVARYRFILDYIKTLFERWK